MTELHNLTRTIKIEICDYNNDEINRYTSNFDATEVTN